MNIMGKPMLILLDSGSQVTAISEDFYKQLTSQNKLSTLPVSNLYVTTAIGKKTTTIKYQAFLEIKIESRKSNYPFLVVPYPQL